MIRHLKIITLIILISCSSSNETLLFSLECDSDINGGNAVLVTLFQLASPDRFRLSSFESLTKNPELALGSDLVANSKFEIVVTPGTTYELNKIQIKDESIFIGVIADFYSPASDGWQGLISINEDLNQFIILIHENSITIRKLE